MFKIIYETATGNYTIYDPRSDEFAVSQPILDLGLNKIDGLTFAMSTSHPYVEKIEKMSSVMAVYRNDDVIFRGRVIATTQNIDTTVDVDCEGLLGYLNDTIKRPFLYKKSATVAGTSNHYLQRLLVDHNSQVSKNSHKIKEGTFDHSKSYETKETGHKTMWELVEGLVGAAGGYIRTRYEDDGVYIDYRGSFPDADAAQKIVVGENVLRMSRKASGDELATAVIPIGKDNLDIKSINGGLDYVQDTDGISQYGFICRQVDFPNISDKTDLRNAGREYLETSAKLAVNYEIEAIDLNLTDAEIEAFKISQNIQVESPNEDFNDTLMLKEMSINLADLQSSTIKVGDQSNVFVDIIQRNTHAAQERAEAIANNKSQVFIQMEAPSEIYEEAQNLWINTKDGANTPMQWVEDDSDPEETTGIWAPVTDQVASNADRLSTQIFDIYLPELEEQMSVEMTAQKEEISFNFSKLEEIDAYIKFINGNIELGQIDSPIKLIIRNNRISFSQNNIEVAFISDNKLNIINGEFLNSLKIGNFAFNVKADGGLSLERI
jgi:hypothetical protein